MNTDITSARIVFVCGCSGLIAAAATVVFFPGFVLAQIAVGLSSAGFVWWGWKEIQLSRRWRWELGRARWFRMTTDDLLAAAPRGKLYLGIGAKLELRHAKRLHSLMGVDRDAIPQDTRPNGDNRVVGVIWPDERPFFIREVDANVHILIYGSTKRGKTRIAELVSLQAILREQCMVVIIDPKGDRDYRRRMEAAAKRAGVPFYVINFAEPKNSATYNPLHGCADPGQVGELISVLCDHGEDSAYWRGRAAGTARVVATAMHAVREYLEACGGSEMAPPSALAALEASRGYQTPLPPMYTPHGWIPRLSVLDVYGVTAPHRLLGWMLRVVYAEKLAKAPDVAEFSDKKTIETWWESYQDDHAHPDDQHPVRGPLMQEIRAQMQVIRDLMDRDEQELTKANSSLFEALQRFRGRISRVVDAPTPDVTWDRMAEQKAVVYFSLSAQEYPDLSAGFARILCADLSAWCGRRNNQAATPSPWYLIADEVDAWIPPSFTNFLARGRSSGMRCVAIGQTRASFAQRLGAEGRAIIEGNAGTVVQFAARGPDDAAAAAKYAGRVKIKVITTGTTTSPGHSGAGGSPDPNGHQTTMSTHDSPQDIDNFPDWAVQNLPTGSALITTPAGAAVITCPEIID